MKKDREKAGSQLARIEELAQEKGIPVYYFSAGDTIQCASGTLWNSLLADTAAPSETTSNAVSDDLDRNQLSFLCMHPGKDADYDDANQYSVTLFLRYRAFSALFTGDLEGTGEKDFLHYWAQYWTSPGEQDGQKDRQESSVPVTISLLKVAHHGSSGATSAAFLSAIRPQAAVISCGRNNRYGHPHQETLERLQNAGAILFNTQAGGEIRFHTNGRTIYVKEYGRDG